jgi:hypothetical protein
MSNHGSIERSEFASFPPSKEWRKAHRSRPRRQSYPPRTTIGHVYVLHFEKPWQTPDGRSHTHYVGWTGNLPKRLDDHLQGVGARETRWAVSRGVTFVVGEVSLGTEKDEGDIRRIGERRSWRTVCRVCRGQTPYELSTHHSDCPICPRLSGPR